MNGDTTSCFSVAKTRYLGIQYELVSLQRVFVNPRIGIPVMDVLRHCFLAIEFTFSMSKI